MAIALVLAVGTSPAVARDLLPLKQGVYVDARRQCKGASNADTLSYWGGDNGVNAQKVACKIRTLDNSGRTFTLRRTCAAIGHEEHPFENQTMVKILSPTSFMIDDGSPPAFAGPTFRYCGRKVEF